jgi:integrase
MNSTPLSVNGEPTELLFAPPQDASNSSARFERFIHSVLAGKAVQTLPLDKLLVACLIAFEAIPSKTALIQCLERRAHWDTTTAQGLFASWSIAGVLHRRELSVFTSIVHSELKDTEIDWKALLSDFNRSLGALYDFGVTVPIEDRVDRLIADSMGWLCLRVPPALGAHVLGQIHMTALPDAIWCRQFGQPKPIHAPLSQQEEEIFQRVVERSQSRPSSDTSNWFVQALKTAFDGCTGAGVNLSNARAKRRLINQLDTVSKSLDEVGLHEVLLLGWLLDLLRHGSARKKKPAIRTIYLYFSTAATLIHTTLRAASADPLAMSAEQWSAFYESILASPSQGQVPPALASFHRFMVRSFDVEPVYGVFGQHEAEAVPDASMVWPEEFERAYQIIGRLSSDERAIGQTRIWLRLLQHTSLRRWELFGLLRRHLNTLDGVLVVEIAPRRGDKDLKSSASRRSAVISDPSAMNEILAWDQRRIEDSAVLDDLLFGDPHAVGLYKAGYCYCLLSQALKLATHDPDICVHGCRHGYASREVLAGIFPSAFKGISRLDQIKVEMGHRSLGTTLRTYAHQYESALRAWVDHDIEQSQSLTSTVVSIWTGNSRVFWRTSKSRAKRGNAVYWDALTTSFNESAGVQASPDAKVDTCEDSLKEITRLAYQTPTLAATMKIATDLMDSELTERNICSRAGVTADDLRCICRGVVQIVQKFSKDVPAAAVEPLVSDARTALANFRFDPARLNWECWARFLNCAGNLGRSDQALLLGAWREHRRHGVISLEDPHATRPILEILRSSNFPIGKLWMRAARCDSSNVARDANAKETIASASTLFRDVFSAKLDIEEVAPRRGRPNNYLLPLTSFPSSPGRPIAPALADSKSLDAAIFCVALFDFWQGNKKGEPHGG